MVRWKGGGRGEEQSVAVASLRWPRGWRPARCHKSTAGAAARGQGADTDIFQDSEQLCMTTREKCLEEPENNLLPLKLLFSTHTYYTYLYFSNSFLVLMVLKDFVILDTVY